MTALAPEKSTGTRCGEMIQSGIVSYRCELELGHATTPESDPEPHYAVEVGRTVRAWQAWKQRQMEREAHPAVTVLGGVNCPNCGSALVLSDDGEVATCVKACGAEPIPVAQPRQAKAETPGVVVSTPDLIGAPAPDLSEVMTKVVTQKPGRDASWEDITDLDRFNAVDEMQDYACPRTVMHPHHFWGLKGEVAVYQCKGDLTDPPAVAREDPAFAAEDLHDLADVAEEFGVDLDDPDTEDFETAEPTKQREGDQPLPDGGHLCVQDRIIEEMEESKRVGLVRYGSVLRTFNGRDSLLDAAEEARDLHVYLTQIRMEAEVTRAQLETVVLGRIGPLLEGYGVPEDVRDGISAIAVDSVMGWVTGQPTPSPEPEPTG